MSEQDARFAGMTINERLAEAGIIAQWDEAAHRRDRDVMVRLLEQIEISEPEGIVDTILANPRKFGF